MIALIGSWLTGGLVSLVAGAALAASIVAAAWYVYHSGGEAERTREAASAEQTVESDLEVRENVETQVRGGNAGKPVADGLSPYYRD